MKLENRVSEQINDIKKENLEKLAQLFPSIIKDGQVDFKALKEELGEFEEVKEERYEFTWAGKQNAKKKVQEDIGARTLKYIEEDSKNPDTTENLYIEGDNLEVLKLLRQNYYGSIKMIYIDPPYNTGNDFVYKDNFSQDGIESDIQEGGRDEEGNRLEINNKSSNRYHANWLNMMYPRLQVARDLLTDNGVIFISIDDNEIENLVKICNEIYGEKNKIGILVWKKKYTGGKGTNTFVDYHEYILVYTKNKELISTIEMERPDEEKEKFILEDEFFKERGRFYIRPLKSNLDPRPTLVYPIELPDGTTITTQWICAKDTYEEMKSQGRILIKKKNDGNYQVYKKFYEKDSGGKVKIPSFIEISNNNEAKEELKKLFNIVQTRDLPFQTPKPTTLLKFFIKNFSKTNDIILDFFSGSASTAHAVMQLNAEDGGNRKYIMVQLSELCDEKSEAYKAGYKNICEIGKERIRRAGELIKKEIEESNRQLQLGEEPKKVPDIGFKVFRTADTNINWKKIKEVSKDNVMKFDDPDMLDFTLGFNDKDVVYEVLLRQRDLPLSEKLVTLTDIGSRTYLYADSYLVCLETKVTEELIENLAELNPLPIKFIFRDSAFGSKIGLKEETFRKLKTLVEKNSGLTKKAYTVEFI